MYQSKTFASENSQHRLSNAKRTELIFNALVLFHAQLSYTEPFESEVLLKCLGDIEAKVNRLYPLGNLRGNHD